MSHLMAQALFLIYFDAVFFSFSTRLWLHGSKSSSPIAKNLAVCFFLGGIQYLLFVIDVLLFSHDLFYLKWLTIVPTMVLCFTAIGYALRVISYFVPKLPLKLVLVLLGLLGIASVVYIIQTYSPTGINGYGIVNLAPASIVMVLMNVLLTLCLSSIGVGFIFQTMRRKLYARGLALGLGLIVLIIFLPLTYQVNNYTSYVFFSFLAAAGFSVLFATLLLHPLLRQQQT